MNYYELSKEVSYALRHAPWEYELEMDEEGWVKVDQLISSLKQNPKWRDIMKRDLEKIIETSDKKRCEIVGERIRAFYGHSIPMKIYKSEEEPPKWLYHGTAHKYLVSIKEKGLLPRGRQYVHLSQDIETALIVGRRRDDQPVLLVIDAETAYKEGLKFYNGNEKVWLADSVPSGYITIKTFD